MPTVYTVTVDRAGYAKLTHQWDYIAQHTGVTVADRYVSRLVKYFRGLATFPERGLSRADLIQGLHVIGFERSANIAIVVEPADVYVVGVYFGGEDYESALRDEPLTR